MANKKKLKQRKKRQLNRALKRVPNPIIKPPVDEIDPSKKYPRYEEPIVYNIDPAYEDQKKLYQSKLDKVYNGAVVALNSYVNPNAVLAHKCHDCGLVFFNAPKCMLGPEYQRHVCNKPYGDKDGVRLSRPRYDKRLTKKKGKETDVLKEIDKLLEQGLSISVIAGKVKLNKQVIQFYVDYKEQQRLKEIQRELGLG